MVVHAVSENKTTDDNSLENEIPVVSDVSQKQSLLSGKAITSERALNHFVPGVYDIHDLENEEVRYLYFHSLIIMYLPRGILNPLMSV